MNLFENQKEIMPGVTLVDALAEIANIGAGNSTTRLEKTLKDKISKNLMGNRVEVSPELIDYCHLSNIELRFPLTTHAGFYSLLKIGDESAMISVLFSMESALFITGLLEAKEKHYEILREEDETTLREISESVIDSYIESTATFLNLPIAHTCVRKVYLKANSISDFVKESIGDRSDVALLFKTCFSVKNTSFKGDLKIILSLSEMDSIINAIRKNLGIETTEPQEKEDNLDKTAPFHLYGGGMLRSLSDFFERLHFMNEDVFTHHVTPFRNDFAAWVYHSLNEYDLALKIGHEKSRDSMIKIIEMHLQGKKLTT